MKKILDAVEKILNIITSVLLAEMVVVIFYQVVLRYIFKQANVWAEELARYSFVWVVMLGSVVAVRRYQHIRIDVLIDRLPEKPKKVVQGISYVLMLSFLAVLFKNSLGIMVKARGQISAGLHIPMPYMYASIAIGSLLMIVFMLENIYNEFISPAIHKEAGCQTEQ